MQYLALDCIYLSCGCQTVWKMCSCESCHSIAHFVDSTQRAGTHL